MSSALISRGRRRDISKNCSTTARWRCSARAPRAIRIRAISGRQRRSWGSARLLLTGAARSGRRLDRRRLPQPPSPQAFNAQQASAERRPIPAENLEAYKKTIARTGEYVHMLGSMLASSAVRLMRESIQPVDTATVWAGQQSFVCPGRIRNDADNPARENVFPGYKDGPEVNLKVGLLRIGDVHFISVNGEIYSQIGTRLKAAAPASQTIVVTLANGSANSGYIYSDDAYSHLTFQVIGSRLKPGCAEGKIVSTAVDLMRRSNNGIR